MPGAWPATTPRPLLGYGLFWGLFISQLMVLFVLTIFVMGMVARWQCGRAGEKADPAAIPARHEARAGVRGATPRRTLGGPAAAGGPPHRAPPAPDRPADAAPMAADDNYGVGSGRGRHPACATAPRTPAPRPPPRPSGTPTAPPSSSPPTPPSGRRPRTPAPSSAPSSSTTRPTSATPRPASTGPPPPAARTSDTAAARAIALLAPVRPTARIDRPSADTAETLLRSWLHAAAVDGRPSATCTAGPRAPSVQDAGTDPPYQPQGRPRRRGRTGGRAHRAPRTPGHGPGVDEPVPSPPLPVNIREACTPNRTDALALDSFVHEGGTLYVVGESIEDPRTRTQARCRC